MPSKRKWLERWKKEKSGGQNTRSRNIGKSEPDLFVKFCRPEHNILNGCRTFRLGTLENFREMEDSRLIADANEGLETTIVDTLSSETASREAIEFVKPYFPVVKEYNGVRLFNVTIRSRFTNCFIWCCSKFSKPVNAEKGAQFDLEYTSVYTITDVDRFGQYIGELLLDSLPSISFADPAREIIEGLSVYEMKNDIFLDVFHQNVVYVHEKKSNIYEGQLSSYEKSIPPEIRPVFVKPMKYKENHEYRFMFLFQHKKYGPLAVRKDPIDVQILPDHFAKLPIAAL